MDNIKKLSQYLKAEVGEICRSVRKRAGFKNAEEASEVLMVSANSVYEIERGENFLSAEMAVRMSKAYNVPVATLFPGFDLKIAPTPEEALAVLAEVLRANQLSPKVKWILSNLSTPGIIERVLIVVEASTGKKFE